MAMRRQYPHVDQVADPQTAQALRLLFDRVFDLTDGVDGANATIASQQATIAQQQATLTTFSRDILSGAAVDAKLTSETASGGVGLPIPPPDIDDGSGAAGCASAGANGHLSGDVRRLPQANPAGQIVCGTAKEFPALTAATGDLATREANAEQLLGRMIWHLQIPQGNPASVLFEAGRQRNPSGAISKDKLTVKINGIWRAYDVFLDVDAYTVPLVTVMQLVFPPDPIPDGGIPD